MSSLDMSHRAAFNLLCNNKIGEGMSRIVFDSLVLPDCVIKVEDSGGHFQNVVEWETWRKAVYSGASRWLAACKWISPCGTILVMEKTRPAAPSEIPAKVPHWLTDFKHKNFGMVRSRHRNGTPGPDWFVCHDYGTNLAADRGMESKRMRMVEFGIEDGGT